jgi:hypothetical protein
MQVLINAIDALQLWQLGLGLFGLFWLAAFLGRWIRKRLKPRAAVEDSGLIVSASLGLMALLLGFTVSMAVSRYDGRRAATLEEANAIGTFLYRTDLMPPELRAATRTQLDRYVAARIAVGRMGESRQAVEAARAETSAAAQRMWDYMIAVGPKVPDTAVRILLVESANHMFDMATARDAALGNTLPTTLVVLLLLFPVASLVLIGYTAGDSVGAHFMASTELILLLTLVLLLIADLNRPRSGTIATPIAPMLDVQNQLKASIARQAS